MDNMCLTPEVEAKLGEGLTLVVGERQVRPKRVSSSTQCC
jgi:hypothetical protein